MSKPYLLVAAAGTIICAIIAFCVPRLATTSVRAGVAVVVSLAGLWLVYPVIQPCVAGPYGALPQEVQALINERIIEARPVLHAPFAADWLGFRFVFPATAALAIAGLLWLLCPVGAEDESEARSAAGILLVFAVLGVLASLFQIRLVLMGAPAYPLLTGYVVASLLALRRTKGGSIWPACALVASVALILISPSLKELNRLNLGGGMEAQSAVSSAGKTNTAACRKPDVLRSLAGIPRGVVLSSSNFGPPLLLVTPHDVLAGPYHRSAEAIANGALPFDGDETVLRAALARTKADYLLLCRNAAYGDGRSYATQLAAGQKAEGLVPVSGVHSSLLLLRVTH